MATAQDIISGALKKLGVLRKSEAPEADESADGLAALNDLLASWSNDNLFITSRVLESFTLTIGDGSYSIGTGADFNTTRPVFIKSAFIRQNSVDYEMDIIDDHEFNTTISLKTTQSSIPTTLTYDNAYPTGTIKIWPVPTEAVQIFLLSEKPITSFANLATSFDMPPGWSLALKTNLAMILADEYNLKPSEALAMSARDSVAAIKRSVARNKPIVLENKIERRYNIYSDR
jgi:hypothetical protein